VPLTGDGCRARRAVDDPLHDQISPHSSSMTPLDLNRCAPTGRNRAGRAHYWDERAHSRRVRRG
jgi:hypothetical protein